MGLTCGSVGVLKGAVTIAVRYNAGRQQFGPPDSPEVGALLGGGGGSLGGGVCVLGWGWGLAGRCIPSAHPRRPTGDTFQAASGRGALAALQKQPCTFQPSIPTAKLDTPPPTHTQPLTRPTSQTAPPPPSRSPTAPPLPNRPPQRLRSWTTRASRPSSSPSWPRPTRCTLQRFGGGKRGRGGKGGAWRGPGFREGGDPLCGGGVGEARFAPLCGRALFGVWPALLEGRGAKEDLRLGPAQL